MSDGEIADEEQRRKELMKEFKNILINF